VTEVDGDRVSITADRSNSSHTVRIIPR